MTSNLGSEHAYEENFKDSYMKSVKAFFKPEFINRIDEIIVFNPLNMEMMNKIAHKFMNELIERLNQKDIQLEVSDSVYENISKYGVDPLYGARPMKRYIQRNIEKGLPSILRGKKVIIAGDHLSMDGNYFNNLSDGYERTVYNLFINSCVTTANYKNRDFSTLDMFPTTLASICFDIEGDRLGLGTNLFSDKKTLIEEYGLKHVNDEISARSKFYNNRFVENSFFSMI